MDTSSEPSDRELVRRIQGGDLAAFEVLYRRTRDWVVSLAYRFCGDREDSLDVLQDTFAYFLKRVPGLDLQCKLKTFLYPAVKHLALSRKRAARRALPLEDGWDRPEEEKAGSGEIEDMLRSLPEAHREVVRLRFAEDLDLKEIAEALGIPLGTVKSRLHLALEALRRRMGKI